MFLLRFLMLMLFLFTFTQANEKLCIENNASACYDHALPLVTGENAKVQDMREKGLEYMRKSCILGFTKACDVMGENYYKDKSYMAARPYLEESCNRDIKTACEAVGVIYRDGHDVRQNDVKAKEYFKKACNLDSGDACYNIAMMYRGGFGVKQSRMNEKMYYEKSCAKGLQAGCDRFKELDNEDKGIETSVFSTVKEWFK